MQQLILVRYGEWENGHLNDQGRATMAKAGQRLLGAMKGSNVCIISAAIPRAIESAQILAQLLDVKSVTELPELYAAEEDGRLPNVAGALKAIKTIGQNCNPVVAVVSREYIETLPSYILTTEFDKPAEKTSLGRGEALILDWTSKSQAYLKTETSDLTDLLSGITAENLHGETTDYGPPRGKELW